VVEEIRHTYNPNFLEGTERNWWFSPTYGSVLGANFYKRTSSSEFTKRTVVVRMDGCTYGLTGMVCENSQVRVDPTLDIG